MPEKSLYFTKALQCKVIKSLVIYWIKVREFWVLYRCVLCQSSVFPRIHAPIFLDKLQKITKCFQCDYKTKIKLKHRTHYAIFQNRRICAICLIVWLGALCGLCILPYINGLRSALVSIAYQAVYAFLVCMGVECVRAWTCLAVLCICKCRCKIYYTLWVYV